MKFLSLILLAAITRAAGKKDEIVYPTMAFVHHLTLSDSKICGDGETVHIQCGLNIMERLPIPEDVKDDKKPKNDPPDNDPNNPNNLRRRLPKEDEKEQKPLFSSDVYEMEITNCTNSVKGQNRTIKYEGRKLIVEAEGFQNIDVASVDPFNNTEQIMTRMGRIKFWEPPTDWQKLMGYERSNHIGNLLFTVKIERKQIVDQTEMFVGMALMMQAMADAIMLNDTGIMFPEPVAVYRNYTRVLSAELEWEHLVNVACSPEKFATAAPTPQPTPQPSANPTAPSNAPSSSPSRSDAPSGHPTVSKMPSNMPSQVPSLSPSQVPSAIPSVEPSTLPSLSPSTAPSLNPSSLPSRLPTSGPTSRPTSGPTSGPSVDYDPQNNMAIPEYNGAYPGYISDSGTAPSRGPSTQQYNSPLEFDEEDFFSYTREYYGDEENPHDTEKPDLIVP